MIFFDLKNFDVTALLELRAALNRVIADQIISPQNLAVELGVSTAVLDDMLNGAEDDSLESWIAIHGHIIEVLRRYGVLPKIDSPRLLPVFCADADSTDDDPFDESAEDVAADETRDKVLLFAWADSVLGLSEAELELELDQATKRFNKPKALLSRIIKARRNDKKKTRDKSGGPQAKDEGSDTRFYGHDFKSSSAGVWIRRFDSDGVPGWDQISTTRMDLNAFTRDQRGENWGTYVAITNRDGGKKKLAIPHGLIAADKAAEIAALLAPLGVGVILSKTARQSIFQFLTTEVKDRITSVPQIGWQESAAAWVFVLPDETLTPAGFVGARPVLQTATLQTQHGLDPCGTLSNWI